jgi:hypothetical protein
MLSKLTSKNQLTIPKEVIKNFPSTEYFEIVAENGRMILTPVRINNAEKRVKNWPSLALQKAMLATL